MKPLYNLRPLREDMRKKGWVIQVCGFEYKKLDYFCVIRLYQPEERVPQFALCELSFLDACDLNRTLIAPACSSGLLISAKELRDYFRIESTSNYGDILRQFTDYLGRFIPDHVVDKRSGTEERVLIHCLSRKDSEDPNKKYCNKVRRNPNRQDGTPGKRSAYNDNKARILRESLHELLSKEMNYSFCFYREQEMERSDAEILKSMQQSGL